MHIALDLTSETGRPGGIRTYWCALLERLTRWHPEDRFTLVGSSDLELPADLRARENVTEHRFKGACGGALKRRICQQLFFPSVLQQHDVDVVHSVNNILPLTVSLPQVLTVLDCTAWHTPDRFSWSKRLFLSTLMPPSVRRARRVLTISEVTRRDIVRLVPGVDAERLRVIPLGVEERFGADASDASELARVQERYQLPARYTLFVGALEPGKNLQGMLTAMRRLRQQGLSVPPLIVAGGGGRGGIREQIDEAHDVPIRGLGVVPDEDLPALYRGADVFLFPSLWEGFGLPLLEAFAAGTAVITSNRSALPEVAGEAAWLVDPDDPWDIAEAWNRLWNDAELRRQFVQRGSERLQKYSWDRLAEETYRSYQEVVGLKAGNSVQEV